MRRRTASSICLLLISAISLPAHSAPAGASYEALWSSCEGNPDAKEQVSACDALVHIERVKSRLATAYLNRGVAHKHLNQKNEALADYNTAIDLTPDLLQALLDRAELYNGSGRRDLALADYGRVIQLRPRNAEEFLSRGQAFRRLGDVKAAFDDFDQVVKRSPTVPSTRLQGLQQRADTYAQLGEPRNAVADFDQAILIDPQNSKLLVLRGNLLYRLGDYAKAKIDYSEATKYDPSFAAAWVDRCWSEAMDKTETPNALEVCNTALAQKVEPRELPLAARGLIYFRMQNYIQSINDCDKAIAINPGSSIAFYVRSVARLAAGDTQLANSDIVSARAINPKIDGVMARTGIANQSATDARAVPPT